VLVKLNLGKKQMRSLSAIAILLASPVSAYATPVPEPSSIALFAVGIGAALYVAKRKKR